MSDIQQVLGIIGATIEEINLQPTEKEPKAVLVISAPLSVEFRGRRSAAAGAGE